MPSVPCVIPPIPSNSITSPNKNIGNTTCNASATEEGNEPLMEVTQSNSNANSNSNSNNPHSLATKNSSSNLCIVESPPSSSSSSSSTQESDVVLPNITIPNNREGYTSNRGANHLSPNQEQEDDMQQEQFPLSIDTRYVYLIYSFFYLSHLLLFIFLLFHSHRLTDATNRMEHLDPETKIKSYIVKYLNDPDFQSMYSIIIIIAIYHSHIL